MCSSNSRVENNQQQQQGTANFTATANVSKINGRAVLQPKSNQLAPTTLEDPRASILDLKKKIDKSPGKQDAHKVAGLIALPAATDPDDSATTTTTGGGRSTRKPSSSPKPSISPPPPVVNKLGSDPRSQTEAITVKRSLPSSTSSRRVVTRPGSIAAARREEVALMQGQRKMKIAHYGRLMVLKPSTSKTTTTTTSTRNSNRNRNKCESPSKEQDTSCGTGIGQVERRCSFITPTSDPIYIAYHDEEWGVAVHDDRMLFEMLVLTSAQVGSDWSSVLKKRNQYREAFSGFEAETVSRFTEKDITSASTRYGIDITQVRAAVDNSKRILQVKEELGSLENYLWRYVNHKPVSSWYKSWQKVPSRSSKSEGISKDMVRRGFRNVGPTVIHSFMQAVGLSNDHLVTCPRHLQLQLQP